MKEIKNCPICDNQEFAPFMDVKDNMITKEEFKIVECKDCGFHFTNPIPTIDTIGEYYKGDAYVSHTSTKKGIVNKLYNKVRNKTLLQKLDWVNTEVKNKTLLDVGCGTGHFLKTAQDGGFRVTGLEPDADARAFCESENNIESKPLEELYKLEEGGFDAITMWHVLEHVYDLNKDIEQMVKLLNKDGVLFVAVPNMNSYDARHYEEMWAAYDVPRHLYHFKKGNIEQLMMKYGLKLCKVLPMKFDSYYVSMLSEKYKGGNILKAGYIGWKSNREAKNYGFSSQVYVLRKES